MGGVIIEAKVERKGAEQDEGDAPCEVSRDCYGSGGPERKSGLCTATYIAGW